ncbi:MAG: chemotaxis-specific protein-glutamate methyltransferase CheB [Halobacteriovoraceae bacterium]|nr:chemotaxis-specific protein-glutamate methyltransferase CheB [Halobacteriovoraceae bacterium]
MNILIVDDSIVFRSAISKALEGEENINVVNAVPNGKIAIDYLKQNSEIDLVTLDLEMPVMDGMETLKVLRSFNRDVNVILFSSLTVRGAEKTIEALALGADDFVAKIEGKGDIEDSITMIRNELVPRIKALNSRKVKRSVIDKNIYEKKNAEKDSEIFTMPEFLIKPKLLCIGASTGGPEALASIFRGIDTRLSIPILLVQHMPPYFTAKLAESLNKLTPVEIREAKMGEYLEPGVCYLAPGDYHMKLLKDGRNYKIVLNQGEKVCHVRPSVDVTFKSVADCFDGQVLSIVLTGMGDDGAEGSKALAKKDTYIFIQDKHTSIVWGMPGAVDRANVGAKIIPLDKINELLLKYCV